MDDSILTQCIFANAIASSAISIIGNFILAFFVAKYTNKELKPYKRILIIQIFFDLAYSITGPLSKYSKQLYSGILYYVFSSTNFGTLLPLPLAAAWATSGFFFVNSIENILPLHFIYRYLLICHNKTMGYFSFSIVAFFCLLPASSLTVAFCSIFWPDGNYEIYGKLLKTSNYQNLTLPLYLATKFETAANLSYVTILLNAVNYSVIGFYSFSLVWHFRKNHLSLSPKTLRIQRQFNIMLFIEAAMPFVTSFIPQILNYFGTWMKVPGLAFGGNIMLFVMPWTAALNPVVTISVITAYRKRFLQKILCQSNINIIDSTNQNGAGGTEIRTVTLPTKIITE